MAFEILVPPSGIKPMPPSPEVWSLNFWTTREVPRIYFSLNKNGIKQYMLLCHLLPPNRHLPHSMNIRGFSFVILLPLGTKDHAYGEKK